MKKHLLFILPVILISGLFGCGDIAHNEDAGTVSKTITQITLDSLDAKQAILNTAERMYATELSDDAKNTILMMFDAFATGKLPDGTSINPGSQGGFGELTNPYVASSIVQIFYQYAAGQTIPGFTTSTDNPFKVLLSYKSLTDPATVAQTVADIAAMDPTTYATLEGAFKLIIQSQDTIENIVKSYESKLLDTSSSASKTAGGGGVVLVDQYLVSANIAYVISFFPLFGQEVLNIGAEKVEAVANTLYAFNEATKLKVSFDESLVYFSMYNIADQNQIENTIQPVITDIIKNDIPGGTPVKGDANDEQLTTPPYNYETTDYNMPYYIAKQLYGAPAEQYVSNMVQNRTLELHNKLRENGLKMPKGVSSDIGMVQMAEIVAKYMREYGYTYISTNVDAATFAPILTALFTNKTDTATNQEMPGTAIACGMIKEINKAVDDSAKSNANYKGYYVSNATGTLCGITIPEEDKLTE